MAFTEYFKNFFRKDSSTGVLLLLATISALIVANTGLGDFYHKVMEMDFGLGFENWNLTKPIQDWVNDGLMALFFLLVGLEIKGELKFGKLQSFRSAIFPVVAAVSGATVPAIIYWVFNQNTEFIHGWAIPMATDIAFVIGIIAMLGSRIPSWVKVFVTTIAVVDDLIAVLVIAFFYTDHISWPALGIAALCILVLWGLNLRNTMRLTPYLTVGFVLWCAILVSGIHATIAGVLLAFFIPLHREWKLDEIKNFAKKGFNVFKKAKDDSLQYTTQQAHYYLEKTQREVESPLRRLERKLHKPVYFFIMPLFAFVNAGIIINGEIVAKAFETPLIWGVLLGLFFGKQIGVILGTWILLKFFFKNMPRTREIWKVLYGIAVLCGLGFTMSIFITNISFTDNFYLEAAKIGILIGSLLSGLIGYFLLRWGTRKPEAITEDKIKGKPKDR